MIQNQTLLKTSSQGNRKYSIRFRTFCIMCYSSAKKTITGRIPNRANCWNCIYIRVVLFVCPDGATYCTDQDQIWCGRANFT